MHTAVTCKRVGLKLAHALPLPVFTAYHASPTRPRSRRPPSRKGFCSHQRDRCAPQTLSPCSARRQVRTDVHGRHHRQCEQHMLWRRSEPREGGRQRGRAVKAAKGVVAEKRWGETRSRRQITQQRVVGESRGNGRSSCAATPGDGNDWGRQNTRDCLRLNIGLRA